MKIAFFSTPINADILNDYLTRKKIEMIFFIDNNNILKAKIPKNIKVYKTSFLRLPFFKEFFKLNELLKIYKLLKKENPDIMYATWSTAPLITAALLKKFFNYKLICHVHGSDLLSLKTKSFFARKFQEWAIRQTDRIIVVNKTQKKEVSKITSKKKISVVHNCLPDKYQVFDEIKTTSKKFPYIFSVGRLDQIKCFNNLINAFANIHHKFPEYKLIIAGKGREKENLLKIIKNHKLEDKVIIKYFDRKKMLELMKNADLYVNSSFNEGHPLSVLEAMYFGRPIVAPKVGGIKDTIKNNFNGILVKDNTVSSLAKGINCALLDPEKMKIMGINAKKTILNQYTREIWINKIAKEIEAVADGKV